MAIITLKVSFKWKQEMTVPPSNGNYSQQLNLKCKVPDSQIIFSNFLCSLDYFTSTSVVALFNTFFVPKSNSLFHVAHGKPSKWWIINERFDTHRLRRYHYNYAIFRTKGKIDRRTGVLPVRRSMFSFSSAKYHAI